ncbi:ATP-dependent RNA helicase [Mycolicibacterium conceptionense]|uniref:ATP-dependent RNA helicase n=1 Tax=Mycolicibacterium conceptionense TaxID=451644 RepID=A0A0U1D1R3_9MYCO|nr:ATP-dependent RNA helicase [Mycolicibacterium conceptionense]
MARLATSGTRRAPNRPRALILAPTRELVTQIEASLAPLAAATGLRSINIFGGVGPNPQIAALKQGVDIVIACPGRLEDHVKSGHADLSSVEITVLDEADHMADLGFLPGVKRLLDRTPKNCQRLLFSATLDAGVDVLVDRYLHDPVVHSVDSAQSPVAAMVHHVLHVDNSTRINVVADLAAAPGRTIVFARTKYGAKNLTRQLNSRGIAAVELHGNLSQNARTRNLTAFSDGSAGVLVATDIAARGIHVDDVSLVVHADPPVEHKAYLHRSGRTARAGNEGTVVTLMQDAQVSDVRSLTRKAGVKPTITRVNGTDHPVLREIAPGERVFGDPIRPEPTVQTAPAPRRQGGKPGQPGKSGQPRRNRPNGSSCNGGGAPEPDPAPVAADNAAATAAPDVRTTPAQAAREEVCGPARPLLRSGPHRLFRSGHAPHALAALRSVAATSSAPSRTALPRANRISLSAAAARFHRACSTA